MINIKSLRIGSHVSVDGKRVRVCGITRRKIGNHHPDERPDAHLRYARIHEVEPISITPELLTELGFEYKDKGCWSHWWKGIFHLTRRDESPYWDYDGDISVQHLHELENLFYMIYETELIPD